MADAPGNPFADLAQFVALPRLDAVVCSPDGRRLVASADALTPDGKQRRAALWELDPEGVRPARRLTRSAKGDHAPAFLPNGDLLFVSARTDTEATEPLDAGGLWRLPAGGGEPEPLLARRGGVAAVVTALAAGTIVVSADVLVGPADGDDERRKARADAGVEAILHEHPVVRVWDHDVGPGDLRLFVLGAAPGAAPRDLTPDAGRALLEASQSLTPDGTTVVTSWGADSGDTWPRQELVAITAATGERRVLASEDQVDFIDPVVAPDGTHVVCTRVPFETPVEPDDVTLWLVALARGAGGGRAVAPEWDRRPVEVVWAPDGESLYVVADEHGHAPVFRVDVASGAVRRLTGEGAFSSLRVAPDGTCLYALRSRVDSPPAAVRLDLQGDAVATVVVLPGPPGTDARVEGRLEPVTATAADGTPLRAWLALPAASNPSGPVPLVVWIHGGPLSSWNAWHWRWNPWVLTARGYAVLLPDPALSTGYGQDMVRRGWGQWGGTPYDDVMALTDAALDRADLGLDRERTAAMGGSYGGYLANWVAGHTDRFQAIVTHASLWALDQFEGTTDSPAVWRRQWGDLSEPDNLGRQWSPHGSVDAIRTPMLVIHGDQDYRVPIGEGLRLWDDLVRRGVAAKFLYFPNEGHWVVSPGNVRVWYETVLAFLDHHVCGRPWHRPPLV